LSLCLFLIKIISIRIGVPITQISIIGTPTPIHQARCVPEYQSISTSSVVFDISSPKSTHLNKLKQLLVRVGWRMNKIVIHETIIFLLISLNLLKHLFIIVHKIAKKINKGIGSKAVNKILKKEVDEVVVL
jgi:hypothetical protein